MKTFAILCLSAVLLGVARAEDKPKDMTVAATPAADHKATDVIARVVFTGGVWPRARLAAVASQLASQRLEEPPRACSGMGSNCQARPLAP